MARRTVPTALCAAALAGGLLAGCGGSSSSSGNGVEAKSASAVVSTALAAAERAKSVHVTGAVTSKGTPVKLDLALSTAKGAVGTISEGGLSLQLIRIGTRAYIKGGASLYERYGGAEAAKLLEGKWLEASAASGELAALSDLTDPKTLLAETLKSHGSLTKGASTTIDGQKAIAVTDTKKHGTLYVATSGKPYPIEIVKTGSEAGKFTFGQWNAPVSVKPPPPANVIDLEKLEEKAS